MANLGKLLEGVGIKKKKVDNWTTHGENQRLDEISNLSVFIDEEKIKEKAIALVEEHFPKGQCEERGNATVVIALLLNYLSTENCIVVRRNDE